LNAFASGAFGTDVPWLDAGTRQVIIEVIRLRLFCFSCAEQNHPCHDSLTLSSMPWQEGTTLALLPSRPCRTIIPDRHSYESFIRFFFFSKENQLG